MHFYEDVNGFIEARHFVPMTSDPSRTRPSRITDARKNGWVPSVTTVTSILDKPALKNWLVNQHLEQAYRVHLEQAYHVDTSGTYDQFAAEVRRRTDEQMAKAPDAGTDIHKVLEDFAHGTLPGSKMEQTICEKVQSAIADRTGWLLGTQVWHTERRVMCQGPKPYAGTADLINASWVIDYKSKQTADKFKPGKMAYDEHAMQLAALAKCTGSAYRCANVFVCLETGEVDFHEHSQDDLDRGMRMFEACLDLWYLKNRMGY